MTKDEKQLHAAAKKNDTTSLLALLQQGTNIHAADKDGQTALMLAADKNHLQAVQTLLAHGAQINATDRKGRSALHYAVKNDDIAVFNYLIEQQADIHLADQDGQTPLWHAVKWGNVAAVQLLCELGADINARTADGWTPLIAACAAGTGRGQDYARTMPAALIEAGADIHLADLHGGTAFLYAAQNSRAETLQLLIDAGADVHATDGDGMTALMCAAQSGIWAEENIQLLIENGADVCAVNQYGETALRFAAAHRTLLPVVKILIDAGAEMDACDSSGYTALAVADKLGNTEIARFLLEHGATGTVSASPVQTRKYTQSEIDRQLFAAVQKSQADKIKSLVESGANLNAEDEKGNTPILLAARQGNLAILKLLFDLGANNDRMDDALRIAAGESSLTDCVAYLLARGANVNAMNDKGRTPLAMAVWQGRIANVRYLLEHGADVKAYQTCGDEMPPLISAARLGYPEIVQLLLEHGADPNMQMQGSRKNALTEIAYNTAPATIQMLLDWGADPNLAGWCGQVPLMQAARLGLTEIVRMLIEKGADVNAADDAGSTPLMYVASDAAGGEDKKTIHAARLLIEHGADVNAVDKDGKTALAHAPRSSRNLITALLKEHGAKK